MEQSIETKLIQIESHLRGIERSIGISIQFSQSLNEEEIFKRLNKEIFNEVELIDKKFSKIDNQIKLKFKDTFILFNDFIKRISENLDDFENNKNNDLFVNLDNYLVEIKGIIENFKSKKIN